MTKKLFCELIHGYLALQYFGDDITKLGKTQVRSKSKGWKAK
jgi:hypothetical protein